MQPEFSGSTGIIYLAWHGKMKDMGDYRSILHMNWKRFVEQAILEHNCSGRDEVCLSGQWIRNDLYLCLQLPHETEELEEQLLELGNRLKKDWGRRFRFISLSADLYPWLAGLKLHAGIALLSGEMSEEDRWYEGIKRAIVHGQSACSTERSLKRRALEQYIIGRTINSVYQPIISLKDSEVYGYEALSRFPDKRWFEGPQQLFDFAAKEGLMYPLDRLARERAIEGCSGLTAGQKLFINITAQIMEDPSFTPGKTLQLLERFGLSPSNVVFEITERTSIEDFGSAKKILNHYRKQGYQIAIDDAGAGYSSLQSIVELQPDFIKIDRSLISGIHLDPMKEHMVHTFTEMAAKMDTSLVAEGIEEEEELLHMKALGIPYAQGYFLGRPQQSVG
ncbi:EAL domain-containing protein [Paenibacillus solisilvae]|uniref:EAL domain-containing protein n=1 Tax=Paenibacillus solisilvae TaxID=2486751 RepID=A0ABW0VTC4_9BACL